MPVVTAANLILRVRDYADQPDNGQPNDAYVTDTMILDRLSKEKRKLFRKLARHGVFVGKTQESLAAGASVTLASVPLAILGVYQDYGSSRRRLARLVDTVQPKYSNSSQQASYWSPNLSAAGSPTITLLPTPTAGTIEVFYVPEPADVGSGDSMYLSSSWEDMMVLGAALRCYTRENDSNPYLKTLYEEALSEVDVEGAQYTADDAAVVRNSDQVYTPGCDQKPIILDPADFYFLP